MPAMHGPTYEATLPIGTPVFDARSIILYEDLATGISGKTLCEALAGESGDSGPSVNSLWRMDVLDCPPVSARAAIDVATSDFIVISARGDSPLPPGAIEWLRKHAMTFAKPGKHVLFLSDAAARESIVCVGILRQLKSIFQGSGAAIISYVASPPSDAAKAVFRPQVLEAA